MCTPGRRYQTRMKPRLHREEIVSKSSETVINAYGKVNPGARLLVGHRRGQILYPGV